MSDDAAHAPAPQPYAVLLDVAGRLAVVIGGGPRGERAAKALTTHGADVVVITPTVSIELLRMESDGLLTVENRKYTPGDLDGAFIAVVAEGSPHVVRAVGNEARSRHVLLNVPSDAAASDFLVPSVVQRGGLQIAISTGGAAPAATREVRRVISGEFGWEWAVYVELVGAVRTLAVQRTGLGDAKLAPLFAAIAASDVRDRIRGGEDVTAEELFEAHAAVLEPADADTEGTDE